MTLDPLFIITNQLYEERAVAVRKRLGRRLNEAESNQAWCDAAEQARQEAAQQQQIDMLGAAVDAAYAPMMTPQQAHEAETINALEDLRRGAKELTEAQR